MWFMARSVGSKPLPLREVFAKNVRFARIHVGLSQDRLALKAGLDRTFIGTLERGSRNISIDNIELVSQAVGVAAHELLDPQLAERRGFDTTLKRAARTVRLYTPERKASRKRT